MNLLWVTYTNWFSCRPCTGNESQNKKLLPWHIHKFSQREVRWFIVYGQFIKQVLLPLTELYLYHCSMLGNLWKKNSWASDSFIYSELEAFLANPSALSKFVYLCITSKMLLLSVTYFLRFYWKPFEIVRKITNFLSTKYRRITRKDLNIFVRKCLRCHFLSSVHLDLGWHFALCSIYAVSSPTC